MQWFSIKKYIPPSCTNVFIRAVLINRTSYAGVYDRHFVGMIEDFDEMDNLQNWEMANGQLITDIEPQMYEVTHFALIYPVYKED